VRRATIRDTGVFTGSLRPRSQFVVAPTVGGRLEQLAVNIGDRVRRGQLIAVLDDQEYAQQVAGAAAELAVAEANLAECESNLEVQQREFERVEKLREKKIASESEMDTARAQFAARQAKHAVAEAQVSQREAALAAARVRLSYTRIEAAWEEGEEGEKDRVVGERFVDEGAMLAPNKPIVSILDISSLTVVIHAIERDYPKIRTDQEAAVTTDAFPGEVFKGRVARIAPLLRESSRQARVEIEMPNPEELLKPGMFVRTRIEFARHENVTVVPVAALARRDGRQGVFLADTEKKTASFVPVKLGITEGDLAEVVEPALAGYVVTMGHHLLEDGAAIRLPEATPTGAAKEPQREGAGRPGGRR